jgi:hypothetical protein
MAKTADLIEAMREMAGTPAEMAAAVNLEASDRSFRRALRQLEDEGVLIPQGSTSDRSYRNASHESAVVDEIDQALLDAVPCTAREFSNAGHAVGLFGKVLGARKHALGIETYKTLDGRWLCRMREEVDRLATMNGKRTSLRNARICPKCNQRQFSDPTWVCNEHGVAVDQVDMPYRGGEPPAPRPTADQFAHMAAVAGKGGRIIGSRGKE